MREIAQKVDISKALHDILGMAKLLMLGVPLLFTPDNKAIARPQQ